jgi:hypothetical protein
MLAMFYVYTHPNLLAPAPITTPPSSHVPLGHARPRHQRAIGGQNRHICPALFRNALGCSPREMKMGIRNAIADLGKTERVEQDVVALSV